MEIISIIIPFYNGNRHLGQLKRILDENYKTCHESVEIEVIIINDSPWIRIEEERIVSDDYEVRVINHENNRGIHQARVTGISVSTGKYILMFDQDDVLSGDAIIKLYNAMLDKKTDCIIGNGVFETIDGVKIILDSYGKVFAAKSKNAYCIVGNLLSSPGQCLLRKSAIPSTWLSKIMMTNCSDDLFLWILLFQRKNVAYCNELVYFHVNTGENRSLDVENGVKSDREMLRYLQETACVNFLQKSIFELRCSYREQKVTGKVNNPIKYGVYYILMNSYKFLIRLTSVFFHVLGHDCPKIEHEKRWVR